MLYSTYNPSLCTLGGFDKNRTGFATGDFWTFDSRFRLVVAGISALLGGGVIVLQGESARR